MTARKRKVTAKIFDEASPKASPTTKHVEASVKKHTAKRLNEESAIAITTHSHAGVLPQSKRTANSSDEGPPKARPAAKRVKASSGTPRKRTTASLAAKIDRNDPFWLTTNENSPLANEDLYSELSNPLTYEDLTKADWDDLRESLPPNVPLNPDGYSVHMDFLKYDADFRRGIREFQEDLSMGRLDPRWQEAAGEAMEERARGEFDAYKENQFEEFWGQKQKLDWKAVAGDSAKLKLDVLIQNGLFKNGDFFSYSRVAGPAKARVMVEKECKITAIGSNTLTFAIPTGQLKYARPDTETTLTIDSKLKEEEATPKNSEAPVVLNVMDEKAPNITNDDPPSGNHMEQSLGVIMANGTEKKLNFLEQESVTDEAKRGVCKGLKPYNQDSSEIGYRPAAEFSHEIEGKSDLNIELGQSKTEPRTMTQIVPTIEAAQASDDTVLHEVTSLSQLEVKILEVDGRLNLNEIRPSINPWKALRAKRNNQDLGSLFEMREEFYVWKHPHIPKPPRSGPCDLRK